MPTKTYLPFIEENDNEGETWVHYIPVPGNEDAVKKFRALIEELGFDGQYTFGREMATEQEVDAVIKFGNTAAGYMPTHNKLDGELDIKRLQKDLDEDDDPLYKGGIADYMNHGNKETTSKEEASDEEEALHDTEEDPGEVSE